MTIAQWFYKVCAMYSIKFYVVSSVVPQLYGEFHVMCEA